MIKVETKKYLGQVKNIDKRIKDKIEESEKWRNIAKGTGSFNSDVKVKSSPNQDKMGDAVSLAVDYEKESKTLAIELTELKHRIIQQIDGIKDELFYNILKSYYIKNKSLAEISVLENYSYKQMKRLYENAILKFEELYGQEYL